MAADAAPAADPAPAIRLPYSNHRLDESPLDTGRLLLRPLRSTDADDVFEYQRLDEVIRYIPWPRRDRAASSEHTAKRVGMRSIAADGDGVIFACVLTGEPSVSGIGDRVIGDVMLRLGSAANADMEIGWGFHPAFHGRGYATEAAVAVMRIAFDEIGVHRLFAQLDPRNGASAALCLRLGMRHEATMLDTVWDKDEWQGTAIYAMLAREHAAR